MDSTGGGPRRWVPALVAAGVALVGSAVMVVLPDGSSGAAEQAFASGNQMPNDELLVRDGDRVQAAGQVIIAPGRDVVLCAPVPRPMVAQTGPEAAPTCPAQYAVTLKGFDPRRLGVAETIQGVRVGYTTLTGIWTHRTIEVTDQTVPQSESTSLEGHPSPDVVPCPTPAGGWKTVPNDIDKVAVAKFIDAHKDQAGEPRLMYPNGHLPGEPEVYTVGVAHGSLATFRRALEKVYDGNLCVHQVKLSQTDLTRIVTAAGALMPKNLGVYAASEADIDKVTIGALVYDEALKTALTPAGLDNLQLNVAVKPAR
jgi:hypothetical protein